ncbi:MAG: rhomboid family intramembrane serine protease, partial [Methylobacteriaceae bacterium]|nr:rhomboid family intramembrane serine protease [Methylobacteriaceae bacterium]
MFIPLYDGVALKYLKAPYATYAIIGLNCFIYVALWLGLLGDQARLDTEFGVIPAVLTHRAYLDPELAVIPTNLTIFTSMFLHAGWLHLFGNMIFLWVFADNVEDAMGSLRFIVFYLACGLAGALVYTLMLPNSDAPLIGASGAISGVVAAYLILYPRVHVFGLVFDWLPLSLPAVYCVGAWVALQIGGALFGGSPEVGWWAHVGGIAAGITLTPLF